MDIGLNNNAPEQRGAQRHLRRTIKQSIAAMAIFVAAAGVASAQRANPIGTWLVEDGSGDVRIARCGRALCGFADNGAQVFINMRQLAPGAWSGEIRDVRDNSRYDGTISLVDQGRLRVHGCVPGGGICGDQTWTRAR